MALLLGQLAAQTFNDHLLIYDVEIEQQDKGCQGENGFSELHPEVRFCTFQQIGQRE
jgi:hypothetical protein